MEEVNKLINYHRRYALALIGPVGVLLTGMALHFYTLIRERPSDGLYWATITLTTIGMAICPESNMAKLFATFYLPLAVIALADAVSDVQMSGMRRKIRGFRALMT
ncbi:hypothetical protein EMIHUDRAFT_253547 [Emiliania huxleyi CCMP1516]|uniref:Potassium channel domain-containing protein n=2 Tax=Emiliania huxleyi TaxID=2903 RepID=A0A0D3K6P7_EMIH1|nr:hypothetical protein EMIHUDRAFT_253547 [Emiliania huxleyi CCMP1516]EOD31432.1 hypothetical protein EMIHUDRAFT_253547 [Emiliania huxleyi CCMP1516]|eukprot:XP_005783861.1 hypothetical protein EMIHUDRAFT_253547 [Emiliania huxleyi CCMP1516]